MSITCQNDSSEYLCAWFIYRFTQELRGLRFRDQSASQCLWTKQLLDTEEAHMYAGKKKHKLTRVRYCFG